MRHHILGFLTGILMLACVPRAEAFCLGDNGWGGFIAHIAPADVNLVAIDARIEIDHVATHAGGCYGEIFATTRLIGLNANCTDTITEPHYATDPDGDFARAARYCFVNCGLIYHAGGQFSWNGNEHQEFTESNESGSFSCPGGCQPPPGGCTIEGCVWDEVACDCVDCCPLVFDTSGRGYKLTSADRGVQFDINADGRQDEIAWTDPRREVAFLAYDRNGNHVVDDGEELFGNVTPLSLTAGSKRAVHGFDALAALESGAYGPSVKDGVIDSRDAPYHRLLLWHDASHDGLSQPSEIRLAAHAGLLGIETRHRDSRRRDEYGNEYRLRGISWWRTHGRLDARLFYDVWFVPKR